MRISVLDQSPISEGSTGPEALRNTIDLAQLADKLGYTRYWVAEHHGGSMLAGPSPAALIGYLNDSLPGDFPFRHLARALPGLPAKPELWLLGSSHQSAIWARELSLPYAFADFINPEGADPADIVCVSAICADSDEEAQRLAASGRMAFSMLRSGRPIPVPPVDNALRYLEVRPPPTGRRAVLGTPDTVKAELEAIAKAYNADEVMVVTITHDHAARRHSYELIAEAMRA